VVSVGIVAAGVWQAASPTPAVVRIGSTAAVVTICCLECARLLALLGGLASDLVVVEEV
jgi:hypothetical protein